MVSKKFSLISTLLVFFIFISTVSADYTIDYYTTDSGLLTFDFNSSSIKPNTETTCDVKVSSFLTIPENNVDLQMKFYSPYNNYLTQAVFSYLPAFECLEIGTGESSTKTSQGYYDSRNVITHDGTVPVFSKMKTRYICDSTSNEIIFNVSRQDRDDLGYYPMALIQNYNSIVTILKTYGNYTSCKGNDTVGEFAGSPYTPNIGNDIVCSFGSNAGTCSILYPFNSSSSGNVNISLEITNRTFYCSRGIAGGGTKVLNISVIRYADNSIFPIAGYRGACDLATSGGTEPMAGTYNIELKLQPNELYFLSLFGTRPVTAFVGDELQIKTPTSIQLEFDSRTPDYECGEWSECVSGVRSRNCVDATGIFDSYIDVQICTVAGEFDEVELGFEYANPSTTSIVQCNKLSYVFPVTTCSDFVDLEENIETPLGWTINYRQVNWSGTIYNTEMVARLTKDEKYEGQKSLELNLRPKMTSAIIPTEFAWSFYGLFGGTIAEPQCGFDNYTYVPSTQTDDLNATMISDNFLFPPLYPAFKFAVKKASSPYIQWKNDYFGASPFCTPIIKCYGDCNASIEGGYKVILQELNIFGNASVRDVFTWYGEANTSWEVITADLNGSNINASALHRVLITLNPSSSTSPNPLRLYFDSFYIQSLEYPLYDNCTSRCDGIDYIEATALNGTCVIVRYTNDSYCYGIVLQSQVQEQQDRIYTPPSWVDDFLNGTGTNTTALEEAGFGGILFLVTPFGLGIVVMLVLSALIEFFITRGKSNGMVFGIVTLALSIAFTFYGLFPIEWALLFVISSGMLVAYTMKNMISGGGGG